MTKQSQQLMLMLVIGVLIGTMGVMAWKSRGTGDNVVVTDSTPSGTELNGDDTLTAKNPDISHASGLPTAPEIPKNIRVGLSVSDQPAGSMVNVYGLTLTENHWVAIYDDNDGRPSWILGAGRAHAGDKNLTISVLRPTSSGGIYYAAILNDDGNDVFDRQTDLPPLTPDKVVMVSFVAQ